MLMKELFKLTPVEERNWPEIDRLYQEILDDPEYQRRDGILMKWVAVTCLFSFLLIIATCLILQYAGVIQ